MEISNLLKQKPTTPPPEVFLAVQIQEGLVKTAFWQITDGIPQVLSYGSLQIYTDVDALPEAVDVSLTHALANIESEPNRVLFGLPESWIRDNQLAPENKDAVLQVAKQLDLKPVGFVSITDAVITYLKEKEGIPPSIILTEIGDTRINVAVIRLGHIKGREEVERSTDIAADVAEGLARIDTDQLPSRIMVINGNDQEVEQQLISYSWTDKFPFLHIPKVEIPDPHFSIEAIALAGGSEAARSMGFEVAVEPNEPINELTGERPQGLIENVVPIEEGNPIRESGFQQSDIPLNEPVHQIGGSTNELAEGFAVDSDIENVTEPQMVEEVETLSPVPMSAKMKLPTFKLPPLPKFSIPNIRLPRFSSKKPIYMIIPVALLLLTIIAYASVLFIFSSALIEVQVDPYKLSKSLPVTINDQSDPNSLLATPQTFSIDKSGSLPTTGQATVGDEATGEVLILNKTNVPKSFAKGTVLTGPSSLKFTLNDDINVASSSSVTNADSSILITPGKVTARVTASKFGTDYNLSANSALTLSTFLSSQYEAKVTNGLTGGTSRNVRAVSIDDQKQLLSNVVDQVKADAQSKVSTTSDLDAIPTTDFKFTKQDFSGKVGDEADNLTLNVSATITVLQYRPADLQNLIAKQISSSIPSGYSFDPSKLTIAVNDTSVSGSTVNGTAQVDANLLPQIDTASFANQIKGKSVAAARQLFESIAGYHSVNIKIKFNLPFIADRLPYNPSKITITVLPTQ